MRHYLNFYSMAIFLPRLAGRVSTCQTRLVHSNSAKGTLNNLLTAVSVKLGSQAVLPKYECQYIEGKSLVQAEVQLTWPQVLSFEATSTKKKDAENKAAENAIIYLQRHGVIDENGKLLKALKSEASVQEPSQRLTRKFGNPISALHGIYEQVCVGLDDRQFVPTFDYEASTIGRGETSGYTCKVKLKWPEEICFEGLGPSKSSAKTVACKNALIWLLNRNAVDPRGFPVLCSKEDIDAFNDAYKAGIPVCLPQASHQTIQRFLSVVKDIEGKSQRLAQSRRGNKAEIPILESDEATEADVPVQRYYEGAEERLLLQDEEDCGSINPFTGKSSSRVYTQTLLTRRDDYLKSVCTDSTLSSFRPVLLDMLEKNQVLIVSGQTGCGKSSQVPQMILSALAEENRGTECNIIVTQPRRLAAISLAEWVAYQRGEPVGDSVGYHVRLESAIPKEPGGILFCTAGVLLRRLQYDPSLTGISHLIIDEVHERDVITDFLFILVKDVLRSNSNLRVTLMSASADVGKLCEYFNAPHLDMGGSCYPVKEVYLEELMKEMSDSTLVEKTLDLGLVTRVIMHIDASQPPGAILCFLPGWAEISSVRKTLTTAFTDGEKYWIQPLHSRLSSAEQHRIFDIAPPGVRKVVLATNVAETSLTVPDVVYVVDSGFQKQLIYHPKLNASTMEMTWVAKSNAIQRKGRAGRIRAGVVYRLYSLNQYEAFRNQPESEMRRTPLDRIVLDIKAYNEHLKAEDFLATALEPPKKRAIQKATEELIAIGALYEDETLTSLGRRMLPIPLPPRLAKAVIHSVILGCLDPVLTASTAISSGKELFIDALESREEIRRRKREFSTGSDVIATIKIVQEWLRGENDLCEKVTDEASLKFIAGVKEIMKEHLVEADLITDAEEARGSHLNIYSGDEQLVLATLLSGFESNIVRVKRGLVERGRIKRDEISYVSLAGNVHIGGDSIIEKPRGDFLFYLTSMISQQEQRTIQHVSEISPLSALLLSGKFVVTENCGEFVIVKIEGLEDFAFRMTSADAEIVKELRSAIQFSFKFLVDCIEAFEDEDDTWLQSVVSLRRLLSETITEILLQDSPCSDDEIEGKGAQ